MLLDQFSWLCLGFFAVIVLCCFVSVDEKLWGLCKPFIQLVDPSYLLGYVRIFLAQYASSDNGDYCGLSIAYFLCGPDDK